MNSYLQPFPCNSHPTGAMRGVSPLFHLASRDNSARKKVSLPSHRLVGELSHPIELLLHLVFSALTPTRGNIPHYFSQYICPFSTEVQHKLQSAIFPFPSSQAASAKEVFRDYIFSIDIHFFLHLYLPHCLCRDAGPVHRGYTHTGRERQQWQVAAAQQCSVGNVVYSDWLLNKESILAGPCTAWSNASSVYSLWIYHFKFDCIFLCVDISSCLREYIESTEGRSAEYWLRDYFNLFYVKINHNV